MVFNTIVVDLYIDGTHGVSIVHCVHLITFNLVQIVVKAMLPAQGGVGSGMHVL